MSILAFLHTILRNIILYFGPLVLIFYSISVGVPNTEAHKQSFIRNDFYNKISVELQQLDVEQMQEENPNFLQEQGVKIYDTLVWNTIGQTLATPEWLQDVTETNLDRFGLWINGESDEFAIYLPEEEINKTLEENLAKEQAKLDTENTDIRTCTEEEERLISEGKVRELESGCLPQSVKDGTANVTGFLTDQFNKLRNTQQFQDLENVIREEGGKAGEEVLNKLDETKTEYIPSDYLQPLTSQVGEATNDWQKLPIRLRNGFLWLKDMIWLIVLLYALVLIAMAIVSPLFGKNLIEEFGSIAKNLGLNTTFAVLTTLIVSAVTIFISSFIRESVLPGLDQANIVQEISWQMLWLTFSVLSTALYAGIILYVGGSLLKLVNFTK